MIQRKRRPCTRCRRPRRRPVAPLTNCLSRVTLIVDGQALVRSCPTPGCSPMFHSMYFHPPKPTQPPALCFCYPVTAAAILRLWHLLYRFHARCLHQKRACPCLRRCFRISPRRAVCHPRDPCRRTQHIAPRTQMPRDPHCMAQQQAHMPQPTREHNSMYAISPHTFVGRTSRTCSAAPVRYFEQMFMHHP